MKINYKVRGRILCMTLLGLFLLSCNNSDKKPITEEITLKNATDEKKETKNVFCFRNEYPYENEPEVKDVEEIQVTVSGTRVIGIYNWLPAYKDQRKGNINGEIVNDTIIAQYTFMQEGTSDTVMLSILMADGKVIIKAETPELGMDATINEVDCNN